MHSDFDAGEISVNHAISYRPREYEDFNYTYEVNDPKTDMGKRIIPLLAPVRNALILEKENQEKYGYRNVVEINGYTGFIFCNRYGLMHCTSSINNQIRRIVDDYNAQEEVKAAKEDRAPLLIPRFSCHITRYTFCSRLCENGTNIKVIQQVMGHSDIKATMNIYAEVSNRTTHAVFDDLKEKDII